MNMVLNRREDPNARSGSDVQHLTPATDFYKRLALDCSGAQVAVDLFLLNSQYADLASLSQYSTNNTPYHNCQNYHCRRYINTTPFSSI